MGYATHWTSSPPGATRCRTSSWPGSVPGCRVSTIEARGDHRARRAGHRSLPGPGRLRRRGIGHARERGACGRRAAATEPGTARLGEMSTNPRAGARGQAHRGTWSGAPQVAGERLDHRTLGDLRGDTRAAVSHVPTRLPDVR